MSDINQSEIVASGVHLRNESKPLYMRLLLVLADMAALSVAVGIGVGLKIAVIGPLPIESYLRLWPFLLVFVLVFALEGLYSGIALSPPEELRRVTLSTTVVFLFLAAVTVSLRNANSFFTWMLLLSLLISVMLVPLFRALVRHICSRKAWWGYPAVIFADEAGARRVLRTMKNEPGMGLKPVAVVCHSMDDEIHGVPVVAPGDFSWDSGARGTSYGVLALPDSPREYLQSVIESHGDCFSHLLVIPDLFGFSSLWVQPKSFGGILGLEARQQVQARGQRLTKRTLDLLLTISGGLIILPAVALITLWVRLDSRGPVFFGHRRIGRGGRYFQAWKFRTMALNGEEILQQHFAKHPEALEEWEQTQKLKDDPRVTNAGRFLRKTSLDELPQLWNVLRNEMSLVGPRPIVQDEVVRYGDSFGVYSKVEGGVTGLWQVSGRNDTTYAERVSLDTFYVRNWSVWLDLCILFRTIGVVLFRKGAY